jgi:putative photosynthetic complex assembly protein 2
MHFVLPAVFAVLLWWFSTGAILCALRRGEETQAASLGIATLLLVLGGIGLYSSGFSSSVGAAYIAFLSALLVWAWHELTFLMGLVTGPRTTPCAKKQSGRAPLVDAVGTVIYHELAIAASAAVIVALTWGGENQTGTWTYVILWLARLSAKVNVYLGVPNLTEEFLPRRLSYLKSYFCHRPMNMAFPLSVTLTTLATAGLCYAAARAPDGSQDATGFALLATLMGLALIEHWFLVLPFNSAQLWTWGTGESTEPPQPGAIAARSAIPRGVP